MARGRVDVARTPGDASRRSAHRGELRQLRELLTKRAHKILDERDRAALGVGGPPIVGGDRQRASARIGVLHNGPRVRAMTVKYVMSMRAVNAAGRRSIVRQEGVLVLVRAGGLHIDLADVRYTPPERGAPPAPQPTDAATTAPTEGESS